MHVNELQINFSLLDYEEEDQEDHQDQDFEYAVSPSPSSRFEEDHEEDELLEADEETDYTQEEVSSAESLWSDEDGMDDSGKHGNTVT